jgi:ribonucleoside-diphosphate reductase alpha chain
MKRLTREAYLKSSDLAAQYGSFPMYDPQQYLAGQFVNQALDQDVLDLIRKQGIRNSHLVSIAPTGTISLTADNVSSGIEPVFAYSSMREIQYFDGPHQELVEDYGFRVFGTKGKVTKDVTIDEHLAVLAAAYSTFAHGRLVVRDALPTASMVSVQR